MTLSQILYYVVRAAQEQYSPYPPDENDAAAVDQYIKAAGNTDDLIYDTVGRLTFRAFMQGVDVDEVWANTEKYLWGSILLKTQTCA